MKRLFALALLCATPAQALDRDRNGDGRIDWREAQSGALLRFAEIDANDDERLSSEELREAGASDAWMTLDRNGDGLVDPREHNRLLMFEFSVFMECDVDEDEVLTGDETACFDL